MSELQSLAAITASTTSGAAPPLSIASVDQPSAFSFSDALSQATAELEARVATADELVRRFVVDDSIPAHEVTIALEEARLAVDLALQVRTRVVEAYREIMNMQL